MDMGFLRQAERLLSRRPARLDHAMLVAALGAQQAASAGARAQRDAGRRDSPELADEPLIELLVAGPAWRKAASAQRGCFNRAESERRINVP